MGKGVWGSCGVEVSGVHMEDPMGQGTLGCPLSPLPTLLFLSIFFLEVRDLQGGWLAPRPRR